MTKSDKSEKICNHGSTSWCNPKQACPVPFVRCPDRKNWCGAVTFQAECADEVAEIVASMTNIEEDLSHLSLDECQQKCPDMKRTCTLDGCCCKKGKETSKEESEDSEEEKSKSEEKKKERSKHGKCKCRKCKKRDSQDQ